MFNSDDDDKVGCLAAVGGILLGLLLLIFAGSVGWCFGWLGGWFLSKIVGAPVVAGLNLVLGNICAHTFVVSDIPLVSATLGFIGGFFKATFTHNTAKKD